MGMGLDLKGAVKISSHCLQFKKLDICIMKGCFIKKFTPDHIKPTHRTDLLYSKLCYSKFSLAVMVLGSRQSPLYNQGLNFQFHYKSKLGGPIPDKKMMHLLTLKELHSEHILALYHAGISSGSVKLSPSPSNETFGCYIRAYKCCLKNLKFQLS